MALKLSNNATSTLAASITAGSTTLSIQSGDAGKFPTLNAGDWHPLTVLDELGNMEIMRCTARAGSLLTVERGKEGTIATAFTAGSRVDLRLTAAAIEDKVSEDQVEKQLSTLTTKTAPADADGLVLTDAAASNVPKRVLWSTIKSTIKDYLSPFFASVSHKHSASDINSGTLADARMPASMADKTFTGTLRLPAISENHFKSGTGDGASYTVHNVTIKGWWGWGFADYADTVRGFYDFRTGTWDVKGGYKINGQSVWHPGNFNPTSKLNANAKAVDSAKLNGATDSASETANSIAKRTSSGDLVARLFQSTYGVSGSLPGNREFIMRGSTSDPFLRPITTAAAAAAIAPHIDTTPPMYTGSSSGNTNYPVGSYLLIGAMAGSPSNNLALTVRNTVGSGFSVDGNGTVCAGTWRSRGRGPTTNPTSALFQRVA